MSDGLDEYIETIRKENEQLEQQLKEAESVIESLQTRNDQQAKILEFFETNSPIFYKQMLDYFLQTDNYVTIE